MPTTDEYYITKVFSAISAPREFYAPERSEWGSVRKIFLAGFAFTWRSLREMVFYLANSQIVPPGSAKLAVLIPHGLSIGPLISVTPCAFSFTHIASTSSTWMV